MSHSENIHVKLQIDNSYRRFFIDQKITFSELKKKISALLEIANSNFLIKYLDEENEWITINSDMELETGLSLYTKIFRILVELKDTLTTQSQIIPMPTLLTTESIVMTPLYTSDNTIKTDIQSSSSSSLFMVSPPYENDSDVSSIDNNVSSIVDNNVSSVVDETVGTAEEKPWKKHKERKQEWKKERRNGKEEKKKEGRRGGRGGGRGGRGGRGGQRGRKQAEEENSNSSSFEDEGLSVDEAKVLLTSLTNELTLLIENKKTLKSELVTLKESIRNEKENNNSEKLNKLNEQLIEKKTTFRNIMNQFKSTKNRIAKLREIVLNNN